MTDPLNRLLSAMLYRVLIVGAVLVVIALLADGVYGPALALALALATFALIRFSDSAFLR